MIDTVIFDIGRVLLGFEWMDYVHRLFNDPETEEAVTKATFRSGIWNEMDRGIWTEEEVLERFYEKDPGHKEQIWKAFDSVGDCAERTDYAIPWIEELKTDGYRVLYLSNYSEHVKRRTLHDMDFLGHMDGGIFSYEVHSIKPEKEIYEKLIEKYGLVPERCVFIDDNKKNISAAEDIGFKAIGFESYEQAHGELMSLLDVCSRIHN